MASWKKIIVSGSNAELNHITSSGNFEIVGNVSGSVTSTGSFGRVEVTKIVGDGSGLSGISADSLANALTVDDATLGLDSGTTFDGSAGRTISIKDAGVDADALASSVAGNGLTGGAGSALAVGQGDGITVNANDVAITAAQTTITSIINSSLGKIGTATDQEYINFGTSNEVNVNINDTERLSVTATGINVTGNVAVTGDVTAQNYIVSSSVTYMTQSFSSGSTIFGNDMTDTHQFTGSVFITGSTTISETLTATNIGAFTAAGAIDFNNENMTNVDIDSGDIASGVTINKSPQITLGTDLSGNVTLTNLGNGTLNATIANDSVDNNKLANMTQGTIKVGGSSNAPTDLDAKTSGYILVGDGTDVNSVEVTGDVSLASNGAVTIAANAVEGSMLNSNVAGDGLTYVGMAAVLSVDLSGLSSHTIGAGTSEITIGDNLTVAGNLIVQGDTIEQRVANLNVEDRFILLNSGSASGDGGIVVQTETGNGDGVAFAYDDSESRWAFQQGTKLNASASAVAPDAYASAVVTSDDSNYQKNGNIRVEGGEIYIYVE